MIVTKSVHTLAWLFFVVCIGGIPVMSLRGHHGAAAWLVAVVAVEVAILWFNKWKCPLTPIAARFTSDRSANFDIYLPEWLARYNKEIFGTLFAAGSIFALFTWWLGAT